MGEVFLAYDEALARDVAIKVMTAASSRTEAGRARFLREARLAARLLHPHAAAVFAAGEVDDRLYIVMEYVNGRTLEQLVRDGGPLDWQTATRCVRDAAEGLAAAHTLGIVHRDIKPTNLMRTLQGETKVVDFGLAKEDVATAQLTQEAMLVGTPAYMAPEQWMNGAVTAQTDLYSLACTYFFLLTGRPPFQADSLAALGFLHVNEPLPDVRDWNRELPDEIRQLLDRASRKTPNHRFASAGEMATALNEILQAAPAISANHEPHAADSTPASARPREVAPRAAARRRFSRFATKRLTLIVGLVLLGAFVFFLVADGMNSPQASSPEGVEAAKPTGNSSLANGLREHSRPNQASPSTAPAPQPSTTLANSIGMAFALIPAGDFVMGSPEGELLRRVEEYAHPVRISRPFYCSVYEVTQAEYEQVMGENLSSFNRVQLGQNTARFPVDGVSWDDAVEFCRRMSALPAERARKRVYRLPTEAEWEYACRAGTTTATAFGDSLVSVHANFNGNYPYNTASLGPYVEGTKEVGSYRPNAFGLYDMHGNVLEWCSDWYDENYYETSPVSDPQGPISSPTEFRVIRGGSWYYDGWTSRSASRYGASPGRRDVNYGIRVVLVPPKRSDQD